MKSCWRWNEDGRPLPRELRLRLEASLKSADDKAVLQVPELVVPELYAAVAGINVESLSFSYSIL
jgi:tyrosine-protein kinase STYK1